MDRVGVKLKTPIKRSERRRGMMGPAKIVTSYPLTYLEYAITKSKWIVTNTFLTSPKITRLFYCYPTIYATVSLHMLYTEIEIKYKV